MLMNVKYVSIYIYIAYRGEFKSTVSLCSESVLK